MTRLALILFAVAVTLGVTLGATFASPSTPLVIGVNEDHPKFQEDAGAAMFGELSTIGLTESVISVRWDPVQPETIPDEAQLAAAIAAAKDRGVKVVLALYPAKARAVADNGPTGFVDFCGRVATAFPDAAAFIVGNEPNQPRFWQPQFKADRSQASAAAFLTVLAGCYDAIHPTGKQVIGVGLSPRGNDNPLAPSNVSTSPVRFIRALGAAYRASGRRQPIMDAFSFHPYPNKNTDTPFVGYQWPNAGMPNFDRIKQALWDAFNGTKQPHIETGLPLWLDEIGWHVPTEGSGAYTGAENVPTVDEAGASRVPRLGRPVRRLRPTDWRPPLLPLDRRVRPRRIPERRLPRRRHEAARVRRGCAGGRRHERRHGVSGERGRLEAHGLGRRCGGEVPAVPGTRDRGDARENAIATYGLVDVGTKRTLTAADKKAVGVALAVRSTRSARARLGAAVARSTLLRAHSEAAARSAGATAQEKPLRARDLAVCRVQPRPSVCSLSARASRPGELSGRRRRPPGRCWPGQRASRARSRLRSGQRSRRGSSTDRG